MADRIISGPVRRTSRRIFAAQSFGLSSDRAVSALKQELVEAGMLEEPEQKIDLVMVEDYNHFTDLIAEEGVPLARDPEVVIVKEIRYVKVRWHYFMLAAAFVASMCLLAGENILWNVFSW